MIHQVHESQIGITEDPTEFTSDSNMLDLPPGYYPEKIEVFRPSDPNRLFLLEDSFPGYAKYFDYEDDAVLTVFEY